MMEPEPPVIYAQSGQLIQVGPGVWWKTPIWEHVVGVSESRVYSLPEQRLIAIVRPLKSNDRARPECFQGRHADPDNSGMCIYCAVILDADRTEGEDPNDYRRSNGWPDVPSDDQA